MSNIDLLRAVTTELANEPPAGNMTMRELCDHMSHYHHADFALSQSARMILDMHEGDHQASPPVPHTHRSF